MREGFQRIRDANAAIQKAEAEQQAACKAMERAIGAAIVSFQVSEADITVTLRRVKTHMAPGSQDMITLSLTDMVDVANYILAVAKEEEGR
jgi:hypothetical protein